MAVAMSAAPKQHGARVIGGVRAHQRGEADQLGLDRLIALDDVDEIGSLPDLDGIADMVGHETIDRLLPHEKKNGVLAPVVGIRDSAVGVDLRVVAIWAHPYAARLEELGIEVARGALAVPTEKRMRLAQIPEAPVRALPDRRVGWGPEPR